LALRLALKTDEHGVIGAENIFSDILSNRAAGIIGW
jgi:isocitrate/isopropylmalate dehydrogenase